MPCASVGRYNLIVCGFVNNYLKKNGFPLLTEKEILENKLKIDNPKYPTIQTIYEMFQSLESLL